MFIPLFRKDINPLLLIDIILAFAVLGLIVWIAFFTPRKTETFSKEIPNLTEGYGTPVFRFKNIRFPYGWKPNEKDGIVRQPIVVNITDNLSCPTSLIVGGQYQGFDILFLTAMGREARYLPNRGELDAYYQSKIGTNSVASVIVISGAIPVNLDQTRFSDYQYRQGQIEFARDHAGGANLLVRLLSASSNNPMRFLYCGLLRFFPLSIVSIDPANGF